MHIFLRFYGKCHGTAMRLHDSAVDLPAFITSYHKDESFGRA